MLGRLKNEPDVAFLMCKVDKYMCDVNQSHFKATMVSSPKCIEGYLKENPIA